MFNLLFLIYQKKLVVALLICFNICFAEPPASHYKRQCLVNDVTYKEGDPVPSGDSCNTCICTAGEVTCTLIAFPHEKCTQNGVEYSVGDSVPSQSNLSCEVCTCTETGIECMLQFPPCLPPPENCEYRAIDDGDPCTCVSYKCENCTHNGVEYSIRDYVPSPSNNPCERCFCTESEIDCHLLIVDCVPPPDGCKYAGGHQCSCGTLECENCTHNGVEYSIGDSVPSPSNNPCERCFCTESGIDCHLLIVDCVPPPDGCKYAGGHQCSCGTLECEGQTTPSPACSEYDPNCPQGQGSTVREAVLVAVREDFNSTEYGP